MTPFEKVKKTESGRIGHWAARTDTPKRSVFGNFRADEQKHLTPALSPSEGERGNRPPSNREPATADGASDVEISKARPSLSALPLGGGEGQGEEAGDAHGTTLQTAIDLSVARSFIHRFLAKAYEDPTPEGWAWLCAANTQESLESAWRFALARSADFQSAVSPTSSRPGADTLESAEDSEHPWVGNPRYSRLEVCATLAPDGFDAFFNAYLAAFGHAARGSCPLNEIEYGDIKADPLFQPHRLADLAAFYRAFGLEVTEDAGERQDHLCLELEFMCVLAAKEAYAHENQLDADQLVQCRDAQKKFLREHLGRWTPAFTRRLAAATNEPTLGALAEFTRAFIESECIRFGVKPGSEELSLRPVDEAADRMCDSCGLAGVTPDAALK